MKPRSFYFFLGLVALAVLPVRAADRDVVKTFPVQPGGMVKVDSYRGTINVVESDVAEVRVAIHLEVGADTEEQADRFFEALQLEIKAEGDTVSVRARNPRESGVRFVWDDRNKIELTFQMTVPRRCNANLATRKGDITVGSLTGRVAARAETGNIFFRRIDGPVEARTDFGNVIVSHCTGTAVVNVLQGTIRIGPIGGRAELANSTGDIEVQAARAGIMALAEMGDVVVGFPRDFTGEADIRTAGGNIFAKIDPAANCVVKASAVWGKVECALPLAVESGASGKSKLTGRLNQGGPVLKLHASGGSVKITADKSGSE